ncbi:MAG: hypothetical protein R3D83_02315 [Caenibius sp.]
MAERRNWLDRQEAVHRSGWCNGLYRTITGAEAVSLGLVAGAQLARLPMFFGGYPTPASAILHNLVKMKEFGVTTFQAEDEIAAICSAIGASYAGQLGVTSSSGPGIALKGSGDGPCDHDRTAAGDRHTAARGGPSTGLPTKTEQSDLYQAVFGRNGDAPMPVIAARSPADAFECAIEACRIATQYMTPVMLLTGGWLYRQCGGTVEGSRSGGFRAVPGQFPAGQEPWGPIVALRAR